MKGEIWNEDLYEDEDIYTDSGIEILEDEGAHNASDLGFMTGYNHEYDEGE